jgi:amino acid adenylation domain-containing protein
MRARVVERGGGERRVQLTVHHMVFDEWSKGIVKEEIERLYERYVRGEESDLEEVKIQYGDYAEWQRERYEGKESEEEKRYWREELKGARAEIEMPTDRGRPAVQGVRGGQHREEIGEEVSEGIRGISRREGATEFMVMLAAFESLLHRYSGQEEMSIGVPMANRNRVEVEGIVGLLTNTVVLRGEVRGGERFRELLREVRKRSLRAYAHQEIPFELVVEETRPKREMSHGPLFQVMFLMREEGGEGRGRWEIEEVASGRTKYDLTVGVWRSERGMKATYEYASELFDEATIRRMAKHYEMILKGIVKDPEQRIGEMAMMTESERNQVLLEWNDTGKEIGIEKCLHEVIEERVRERGDAVAVVDRWCQLSYGELNRRANQLGGYLRRRGVGAEVQVGISLGRTAGLIIGALGVMKAGGAYVPLDPEYPRERLAFLLEETGAPFVITERGVEERVSGSGATSIRMDEDWGEIGRCEEEDVEVGVRPGNVAYIIYTSGSTGKPKGVAIEHRSAVTLVKWAEEVYGLERMERVAATTSICFDLSVYEMFGPLAMGGTVVVMENALEIGRSEMSEEVTLINTVPSAMRELVRMGSIPRAVRTVNLAGEALGGELVDEIYGLGREMEVHNLYGPSEDTTYSTKGLMKSGRRSAPIGRPVWNTQVYLMDGEMALAPIGASGELYIGGEGLARGYLKRPEMTAERFIPDANGERAGGRVYKTGDLARHRSDGEIEFRGRIDHQIKLRGYRIEVAEVESALKQHQAIQDVVVCVREDEPGDRRLVAYLTAVPAAEISSADVRTYLREILPEYMVPSTFVVLDKLPLTLTGKVDRKRLPVPEPSHLDSEAAYAAPRTDFEHRLAQIWKEALRVDDLGINDNFFDLGGHSLMMTQVHRRLEGILGRGVSILALFKHPTIGALARYLQEDFNDLNPAATDEARADQLIAGRDRLAQRLRLRETYSRSGE